MRFLLTLALLMTGGIAEADSYNISIHWSGHTAYVDIWKPGPVDVDSAMDIAGDQKLIDKWKLPIKTCTPADGQDRLVCYNQELNKEMREIKQLYARIVSSAKTQDPTFMAINKTISKCNSGKIKQQSVCLASYNEYQSFLDAVNEQVIEIYKSSIAGETE